MEASLRGCGRPPEASSRHSAAEGQAEAQVGHSGGPLEQLASSRGGRVNAQKLLKLAGVG